MSNEALIVGQIWTSTMYEDCPFKETIYDDQRVLNIKKGWIKFKDLETGEIRIHTVNTFRRVYRLKIK